MRKAGLAAQPTTGNNQERRETDRTVFNMGSHGRRSTPTSEELWVCCVLCSLPGGPSQPEEKTTLPAMTLVALLYQRLMSTASAKKFWPV